MRQIELETVLSGVCWWKVVRFVSESNCRGKKLTSEALPPMAPVYRRWMRGAIGGYSHAVSLVTGVYVCMHDCVEEPVLSVNR